MTRDWAVHLLRVGPAAVVAAAGFVAAQLLRGGASVPETLLIGLVLLAIVSLLNLLVDRLTVRVSPELLVPLYLNDLRTIVNECARSGSEQFTYTTVWDFIERSEGRLEPADEMHILTHDIDAYDSLDYSVPAIARNLERGVKYTYYLPHHNPTLREQVTSFVDNLQRNMQSQGVGPAAARERLDSNLRFLFHRDALLYYFAYIQRRGEAKVEASWYITSPDSDARRSELVTTPLGPANRDRLIRVLTGLRHNSAEVVPSKVESFVDR